MKAYFVYILTNYTNKVFYIGVTNSIERRLTEHSRDAIRSFVTRYKIYKLVYYEEYTDIREAIVREKQFKNWHREWKVNLITQKNPGYKDLYI
jgi:putative endonuclease